MEDAKFLELHIITSTSSGLVAVLELDEKGNRKATHIPGDPEFGNLIAFEPDDEFMDKLED